MLFVCFYFCLFLVVIVIEMLKLNYRLIILYYFESNKKLLYFYFFCRRVAYMGLTQFRERIMVRSYMRYFFCYFFICIRKEFFFR